MFAIRLCPKNQRQLIFSIVFLVPLNFVPSTEGQVETRWWPPCQPRTFLRERQSRRGGRRGTAQHCRQGGGLRIGKKHLQLRCWWGPICSGHERPQRGHLRPGELGALCWSVALTNAQGQESNERQVGQHSKMNSFWIILRIIFQKF